MSDEGVSGTVPADQRPGLSRVLQAIRHREVHGLVIARPDRLARSLVVSETFLAQVWAVGGEVFSADTGLIARDSASDPTSTLIRQLIGSIAQLDRAQTVGRLHAGRMAKARAGGYAHGAPRFGYRAEGKALVADPGEQAVVKLMTRLRTEGRTYRAIAQEMNDQSIPSKHGGAWHPSSVRSVVQQAERRERLSDFPASPDCP